MNDRLPTKKAFAPFAMEIDEIDTAAEELARKKNIPTLTLPEQRSEQAAPKPQPSNAKVAERGGGSAPAPAALSPDTEVAPLGNAPRYVLDQLHAAARLQRSSVKYVVLCALKAQGFEVRDEDLIPDGRRLRGSRTA